MNIICPYCGDTMIWQSDFNYDEVFGDEGEGIVSYYHCSNCGCDDYTQTDRNGQCKLMRYCPNCGAKMDGTPKERGGEK